MNDDTQVNVRINATDNTRGAVSGASQGFGGLWKSVAGGQIAAQVVMEAWGKLEGQIKSSIATYETVQNLQAQINLELKNTHGASGQTADSIEKYATQLSNTTPISKEAALTGDQVLLKYSNIGKQTFPQAQKAVADLAETMSHGGTVSADTMGTAAKKLGVALTDPEKGMGRLKQAGIALTSQQQDQIKATEKANGVAAAQKLLLDDVSATIGGSATAAGKTLSGQIEILKQKFQNLGEQIVGKLINALKEAYAWYQKHHALINELVKDFGVIVGAILLVWTGFKLFQGAVAIINAIKLAWLGFQLLMETNPIILIITAIIVIGLLLMTHWQQVKAVAAAVFGFVGNIISDVWNWVKSHWPLLLAILTGPIGLAVLFIIDHFHQILDFVTGLPGMILHAIGSLAGLLYNAGKDLVQGFINGIGNMAQHVFDAVKGLGDKAVKALKGVLKIFSPSAVFADLGVQVGAGFAQGIKGTQLTVAEASTTMGQASIKGLSPNLNSGSSNISSVNNITNTPVSNTHSVTIQNLTIAAPNNSTFQTIMKSLNQDQLNASKGLTIAGGTI